jgi:hypothetical protein
MSTLIDVIDALEHVQIVSAEYENGILSLLKAMVVSFRGNKIATGSLVPGLINSVVRAPAADLQLYDADKKLKPVPARIQAVVTTAQISYEDNMTIPSEIVTKRPLSNLVDSGWSLNGNELKQTSATETIKEARAKDPSARLSVDELCQVLIDQTSFEKGYGFFKWVVDNNLPVCFGILSFRPNQVWDMGSLCLTFGGGEVGSMLYMMPDFQIANDSVRKVMIGSFTVYAGALIKDPRKIVIIPDVYCRAYLGGWGTKSWDASSEEHRSMQARRPGDRDFYHCLVEANYKPDDKWMFLNGKGSDHVSGVTKSTKSSYSSAIWYAGTIWSNWESNSGNLVTQADSTQPNTMCFQDYQASYNAMNPTHPVFVHNQGPWGKSLYEGSAQARANGTKVLHDVNTDRVSLMKIGGF